MYSTLLSLLAKKSDPNTSKQLRVENHQRLGMIQNSGDGLNPSALPLVIRLVYTNLIQENLVARYAQKI